jgi:hypothetical protein
VNARVAVAWGVTLVWLTAAGVAGAAPPKLRALTEEYAQKNNLPIRVVKNDLGTREVERLFVPVLPTTHDSFLEHFQIGKGAVVWRSTTDQVHPLISIKPGDLYQHNSTVHVGDHAMLGHRSRGHYLALSITAEQFAHWDQFMTTHAAAGTVLYSGGFNDGKAHFANAMRQQGNPVYGGCMWWLVHAPLAPELNLATAMGVRRAKGPEALFPRLVHAGNELVGPVGVAVDTIEDFNRMTDEQLMGPEPAGGAAEQVKE